MSSCSSENQTFLKELVQNVLKGSTPSVFNRGKVSKLLEDENYRNFVLSKLYVSLERKISENQPHIEDVVRLDIWVISITTDDIHIITAHCQQIGLQGHPMVIEHHHSGSRVLLSK